MNIDITTQQKEKTIFSFKIVGVCVAVMAIILLAVVVFKVSVGTVFFAGTLLACPLLHIWMMKGGSHKH